MEIKMSRSQKALAQVGYEVRMCCVSALLWLEAMDDAERADQRNAFLEAELLHARALFEFLVKRNERPAPDDMLRTAFAPDWKAEPVNAAQVLHREVPLMNKHLVHLSWSRVDNVDPDSTLSAIKWEFVEIAEAVYAVALAWAQHVTTSEGKEWDDPDVAILSMQHDLKDARGALDTAKTLLPPKPTPGAAGPVGPAVPGGVVSATTASSGPLTASTSGTFEGT
jgi:hypothetical protein